MKIITIALLGMLLSATSQALQPPAGGMEAYSNPPAADAGSSSAPTVLFNDSHFHLSNYIQHGLTAQQMLAVMGDKVGRVALFGIPLQQKWDYTISGNNPPSYYLHTDARLYYYSFVDAMIAKEYQSLSAEDQARFDPMITGFNPTDSYAPEHIRRVLLTYPGVFSGIGEFSVHKEFVSSKIAGHAASLRNHAIHRIMNSAGEIGLLVILHNDMDIPHPAKGKKPAYYEQMRELLKDHPNTTTIWAHTGLGRVVKPTPNHLQLLEALLSDPDFSHLYFDISWDEVAKYVVADAQSLDAWAQLLETYPTRFLFGTDSVAPVTQQAYLKTWNDYQPLWDKLSPATRELVSKGNYQRLFDAANQRVRAWEAAQLETAPAAVALPVSVE